MDDKTAAPIVRQRNALLGWDLLWYVPLAALTLLVWVPERFFTVWADLKGLTNLGWKLLIIPFPLSQEFLYVLILPFWLLVVVPHFFTRKQHNVFFPYRWHCVVASYFVAGACEFLAQLLIYIWWPTCVDAAGQGRSNLLTASTGLPLIAALSSTGLPVGEWQRRR